MSNFSINMIIKNKMKRAVPEVVQGGHVATKIYLCVKVGRITSKSLHEYSVIRCLNLKDVSDFPVSRAGRCERDQIMDVPDFPVTRAGRWERDRNKNKVKTMIFKSVLLVIYWVTSHGFGAGPSFQLSWSSSSGAF